MPAAWPLPSEECPGGAGPPWPRVAYTFRMVNQEGIAPSSSDLTSGDVAVEAGEPGLDAQVLRASAMRQARWLIEFYRITPEELVPAVRAPEPEAMNEAAGAPEARPVKYRHPVSGETWDGDGPHPQWMRQALLHDGYRVEELRVTDSEEDPHARPAA